MPAGDTSTQRYAGSLETKQLNKENKSKASIWGKRGGRLYLLAENMIVCKENPSESTKIPIKANE